LVRDIDKALADILEIRSQIAAHTIFRGYGPVAISITGILGFSMALAQSTLPIAPTPLWFIAEWLGTAALCIAVIGIEMQGRSRRLHSGLADTMIHQSAEQFMPAAAASVAMPALLLMFSPQNVWMMPGLWQIFVSLGLFASLQNMPRNMILAGAWYFVSGFAFLLMGSLTHALMPWTMGLPFLGGQLLMAAILYFSAGGRDGED
jgi:hypothetical protein